MVIKHYTEVTEEAPTMAGAQASLRWLVAEKDGARNFAMRVIEIKRRGDKIPLHTHNYEHETFVISGKGKVGLLVFEWVILGFFRQLTAFRSPATCT
jgi:quercetin dioxygenase-like cupin family protein